MGAHLLQQQGCSRTGEIAVNSTLHCSGYAYSYVTCTGTNIFILCAPQTLIHTVHAYGTCTGNTRQNIFILCVMPEYAPQTLIHTVHALGIRARIYSYCV